MVLGSSGDRLDRASSCLAGREGQQTCEKEKSKQSGGVFALSVRFGEQDPTQLSEIYLSVRPEGRSSLLLHWQRSGRNPGSMARPCRWPRRRGCSPSSALRRSCGTAWPPCPPGRAELERSSRRGGSQGSTRRWEGRGWRWGGGTLPPTLPQNDSGDQGC